MENIEQFNVVGISIRTTNENGQAMRDIPALWNRFVAEKIVTGIPNKTDDDIYCIYTDYELDHTKPYTTILGCKVSSLDDIPAGMTGKTIEKSTYSRHTAKGNLMQGSVITEWVRIWSAGLPRAFTADFEVYGEKAKNPQD